METYSVPPRALADATDLPQFTRKGYVDALTQGLWDPSDQALLCWNFDPLLCDSSAGVQPGGNGWFFQMALKLDAPATVSGIAYAIRTAGATLTSGQSLIGLFDASSRVAVTADQSTTWTSAGAKVTAFASAVALAAGVYYAEFLSNGTTRPTFVGARAPDTGPLAIGRTLAAARSGANTTAAATAMPTSKPTPNAQSTPIWCALY